MGSDESHFNVSLTVRDKVKRQCPQTTTFEEKGEPKRYRIEVLPLTSLTPYRQAKPALSKHGPIVQIQVHDSKPDQRHLQGVQGVGTVQS